jgi:hypothetical protein
MHHQVVQKRCTTLQTHPTCRRFARGGRSCQKRIGLRCWRSFGERDGVDHRQPSRTAPVMDPACLDFADAMDGCLVPHGYR